jgi:hypothetical protein
MKNVKEVIVMSKMLSKMNLISVVQQLPNEDIETIQGYVEMIEKENTRLLELCMYGLIRDTKIYNREIDDVTKLKFMSTIKNNLTDDTYTLRKKLINIWKSGE